MLPPSDWQLWCFQLMLTVMPSYPGFPRGFLDPQLPCYSPFILNYLIQHSIWEKQLFGYPATRSGLQRVSCT
ncbi:hypothetical protein BDV26DRAFT_256524 [Aspergillus bertholletiae]|uniref:Uncharacterized protein n=1 Tax=Aspergillus bertholletiae TaxID=1226010 RepID=A0A5N7BGM4_9EURO|nr:hypothetical protein BDV26DRAFT_256524 [Aspergillus bertholletiae]